MIDKHRSEARVLRDAARPFAELFQPFDVLAHAAYRSDNEEVICIGGKSITLGQLRGLAQAIKPLDRWPRIIVVKRIGRDGIPDTYHAAKKVFVAATGNAFFSQPIGAQLHATYDEAKAEAITIAGHLELEFEP